MKYFFAGIFFVFCFGLTSLASSLALAQIDAEDAITYSSPTKEMNEAAKATLALPTQKQKKQLKPPAAKKAKKQKIKTNNPSQ